MPETGTEDAVRCSSCGGPFHPATGGLHWVEFTQRWIAFCGPCERDFVDWLVRHMKGRTRRVKQDGRTIVLRFYDHAHPPKGGK